MRLKRILIGIGAAFGLGLAAFAFIEARSQWVDAGYVGILYDASAGVKGDVIPPRRVFVGWRQRLYTYPTKLQSAKYLQAADEGEVKAADGILITTNENANTLFDVAVVYRVQARDALKVFNAFGPIDIQSIQTQHLRRAVKDVVNEIGPQFDIFQIMGPKRGEFCDKATEALRKRMEPKGLTIDSLFLMTAYPSPETQQKIVQRINQYTEYEIALLRQKIAEVQRQTNVLTARARAEATRLTSASAKDTGIEQLQLQADEEAIEKWDGHLPPIKLGGGQTTVLDAGLLTALRGNRASSPTGSSSRSRRNDEEVQP